MMRATGFAISLGAFVAVTIGSMALGVTAASAQQPVLVVNSTGDRGDSNPGDGVCLTSSGKCSLRAAIEEANARSGPDLIRFNIAGGGVKTITIGETLVLNDRSGGTSIDGYSQPGASANSSQTASNAAIAIEVTTTSSPDAMFLIESARNTIRGLSIYGNAPRIELRGEDADGNSIVGNFLGTNAAATATSQSPEALRYIDAGVVMNLGPDKNMIGTANRADRNVIAGNARYGIRINHGETSENIIENNIIGLSPDLSRNYPQGIGIDLQWWTWGNYVTGNLISGHRGQGVDLSHSTMNNVVVNNHIGTGAGGNGGDATTANRWGISMKDNPVNNHVADNIIGNSTSDGIWHRHNYTGANTFVRNRIGVGAGGAAIGNAGYGVMLRGHDDLYVDNIIANNDGGGVYITNDTPARNQHTNYPPEKTIGNRILQTTFYNTAFPFIDIEAAGSNSNDSGDSDDGAHTLLNVPVFTGIGPGEVYGQACVGCSVEIYVSGVKQSDGSLDLSTSRKGQGAAWIGTAKANGRGRFSLASADLRSGKNVMALAVSAAGNTSELSPRYAITDAMEGSGNNAARSEQRVAAPATPPRPGPFAPQSFSCRHNDGTLSWSNSGAAEYYVFYTIAGAEFYLGPKQGTTAAVPGANSYRVEHWESGFAANAGCPGGGPAAFDCSFTGGVLSWTNSGADTYYAFAILAGVETYLGPITGTGVSTPRADSFRVEYWMAGRQVETVCLPGR